MVTLTQSYHITPKLKNFPVIYSIMFIYHIFIGGLSLCNNEDNLKNLLLQIKINLII